MLLSTSSQRESRLTQVSVISSDLVTPPSDSLPTLTSIGRIPVTSTMSWPLLDSYVGKVFQVSLCLSTHLSSYLN